MPYMVWKVNFNMPRFPRYF